MRSAMAAVALAVLVVAGGVGGGGATENSPAFEHVHALGFDAAGRLLWLGAHTGLYRSEDGGRTWAKATLPAQGHGGPKNAAAVAVHPTQRAEVYAASAEGTIFVSRDGGQRWDPVR